MAVTTENFGTFDGGQVTRATLAGDSGVEIKLLSYGGRISEWHVPTGADSRNVVLGWDRLEPYLSDPNYFGSLVGRIANRIGGSSFSLDGRRYTLEANEGPNHLHSGPQSFALRNWKLEPDSANDAVKLSISSPGGEGGYPGAVETEVVYRLDGHALRLDFTAHVSEPTPINMVQHHYFNLAGSGDVLGHKLEVAASRYTVLGEGLIPTGEIASVEGTDRDFREARTPTARDGSPITHDFSFVLDTVRDHAEPVARLEAPDGVLVLELWTDQPGLQFYNGAYIKGRPDGPGGRKIVPYGGICLEDQGLPDAVNHAHFPSILVTPDKPYRHICEIEIAPPA